MRDWKAHLEASKAVQSVPPLEVRICCKDGATRTVEVGAVSLAGDQPDNFLVVLCDVTQQKLSEFKLNQSRQQYVSLVKALSEGIVLQDASGRIIANNPAAEEILGLSSNQLLGLESIDPRWKAVREDGTDFPGHEHPAMVTLRTGKAIRDIVMGVHKPNGTQTWIEVNCEPILHPDDASVQFVVASFADVTTRRMADAKIRESMVFAQSTIDALAAELCVLDAQGRILTTNQAWSQFESGASASGRRFGIGDNYLEICDRVKGAEAREAREFADGIRAVIRGERDFFAQEYACHSPTEHRWFVASVTRFHERLPARVVVCHENITERKRSEESHARLATAVEQASDTIVITDTAGTILYVNPAFERVSGYSREEAIGNNPRLLKSDKLDAAFYRNLWGTLRKGNVWSGHFINRRKDGRYFEEDATITPLRNAQGRITNYVAVKRDVTHELQLEAQFHQAQKMEAIGALAGGIAHDFNNILTVIFGYSYILQHETASDPSVNEKVREILKVADRAKDLVQQILTFSRKREQKKEVIRLDSVIKEATKFLRASLPANIQIDSELSAEAPAVLADPTQIYQVAMNLATNALHSMEGRQGVLTIRLDAFIPDQEFRSLHPNLQAMKYTRLTVADTGSGMDQNTLQRIFEPFFTTKPVGKGTGLGLAVVHGIVQSHEGVITVASEPGKGTTFEVYFPARNQTEALPREGIRNIALGRGQRILVVDDEIVVTTMLEQMLTLLNYRVTVCNDPRGAVELCRTTDSRFDLVITDLTMPELNGLELASQIRQFNPDLPILLTTGFKSSLTLEDLKQAGVHELLEKPVSMNRLAELLQRRLPPL